MLVSHQPISSTSLFSAVSLPHTVRFLFIVTWLKTQAAFLVHPQLGGQLIPVKQWHMLLNIDSMKKGTDTCTSATQEVVEKLLKSVLEDTMAADDGAKKKLEWKGSEWTAGLAENTALVKEVLWELSKLNFHYDDRNAAGGRCMRAMKNTQHTHYTHEREWGC